MKSLLVFLGGLTLCFSTISCEKKDQPSDEEILKQHQAELFKDPLIAELVELKNFKSVKKTHESATQFIVESASDLVFKVGLEDFIMKLNKSQEDSATLKETMQKRWGNFTEGYVMHNKVKLVFTKTDNAWKLMKTDILELVSDSKIE